MHVRYRDLLTVIARASDVGMARPEGSAELTALAAHRLSSLAGHPPETARSATYVGLLQFAGCTSDARAGASLTGDEMAMNEGIYGTVHHTEPAEMLAYLWRVSGEGQRSLPARLAHFGTFLSRLPGLLHTARAHCEVNDQMADRVALEGPARQALRDVFEGWNGSGVPRKLRGEVIALPARVATIAESIVPAHRIGGPAAIRDVVRRRAGRAFDPSLAALADQHAEALSEVLRVPSPGRALHELDLGAERHVDEALIDGLCQAVANFADLKCVHTRGDSTAIADLAVGASKLLRVPAAQRETLRRAALLHAVGRVGISVRIWEKRAPLDDAEWSKVRTHTLLTERVLHGTVLPADVVELASLSQERLDGRGYHRRLPPVALPVLARVLACASVFHALRASRPHRPARTPTEASALLRSEVERGRLCGNAAEAVIAASGERPRVAVVAPHGLTEREVEVLGLVAHGLTNKQIAAELGIRPKTAGNHVQNLFGKIGVSTRAAAAMYAMKVGLVPATQGAEQS